MKRESQPSIGLLSILPDRDMLLAAAYDPELGETETTTLQIPLPEVASDGLRIGDSDANPLHFHSPKTDGSND